MNDNLPSRPKLSGSLAASIRRNVSTPAAPARSLPSLPVSNPVSQPVAQTASAPRATATTPARSLPAIPVQNTLPVVAEAQPAVSPVKEAKVSSNKRSESAKKRNRGSVITPRDKALLKFLGEVNIATAALIAESLSEFKYKDVRTGEYKAASTAAYNARLTVLRKRGVVDYKNNRAGTTVWFLTWDGYEEIDMPFPENRPRHQRNTEPPKPQKARVAPKESKWAHTLGLAAMIINFKNKGYQFITDDQMLSASEEMRALNKHSKGYISDTEIRKDLSFKDIDQFSESADHFTFPNWEGGSHRPDLVVLSPEYGVIAVELELHRKNIRILKSNFMGCALSLQSGRFDSVAYWTVPKIEPFVRRYLKECVDNSNSALRPFYEQISIHTYIAADWNAEVPDM